VSRARAVSSRRASLTAIEINPDLATKARRNLATDWPQATLIAADGFTYRAAAPADAIVINAGMTPLSLAWLGALAPENGRLLVPMSRANLTGGFLLITRNAGETRRYPARYVMWTGSSRASAIVSQSSVAVGDPALALLLARSAQAGLVQMGPTSGRISSAPAAPSIADFDA
jgi:protein-L-isoaspartate O-methyltransferase